MKKLTLILAAALLLLGVSQAQFLSIVGSKTVSAGTPTAATPTFSPVAGAITSGTTIAITSSTSGATICYTLDNSTPTATTPGTCSHGTSISNGGSTSAITSALTVEAIATKASYINSSVASAAYTISSGTVSYSDNFASCTAGTINANWSVGGNWGCDDGSGWLTITSADVISVATYSAGTWTNANQWSQATCNDLTAYLFDCDVLVRTSGTNTTLTGYLLGDDTSEDAGWCYLNTVSAGGTATQLGVYLQCGGIEDTIYLSANVSALTAKLNGATIISITDSTYTSGTRGAGIGVDFYEVDGDANFDAISAWAGGTL